MSTPSPAKRKDLQITKNSLICRHDTHSHTILQLVYTQIYTVTYPQRMGLRVSGSFDSVYNTVRHADFTRYYQALTSHRKEPRSIAYRRLDAGAPVQAAAPGTEKLQKPAGRFSHGNQVHLTCNFLVGCSGISSISNRSSLFRVRI